MNLHRVGPLVGLSLGVLAAVTLGTACDPLPEPSCETPQCPAGTTPVEAEAVSGRTDVSLGYNPSTYEADGAFTRLANGECVSYCQVIQPCPMETFPVISEGCFTCGAILADSSVAQGSCGSSADPSDDSPSSGGDTMGPRDDQACLERCAYDFPGSCTPQTYTAPPSEDDLMFCECNGSGDCVSRSFECTEVDLFRFGEDETTHNYSITEGGRGPEPCSTAYYCCGSAILDLGSATVTITMDVDPTADFLRFQFADPTPGADWEITIDDVHLDVELYEDEVFTCESTIARKVLLAEEARDNLDDGAVVLQIRELDSTGASLLDDVMLESCRFL